MKTLLHTFHKTQTADPVTKAITKKSRIKTPVTKESISWKMHFYKFLAISFGTTTVLLLILFLTSKFFDTYKLDFRSPIIVQAPIVMSKRVLVSGMHEQKLDKGLVSPIPDSQIQKKNN